MDYSSAEDNPCCTQHNYEPYTKEWWACVDKQHVQNEHPTSRFCDCYEKEDIANNPPEYYTADVLYDMTHESNPNEWSGGYYNQPGFY